MPVTTFRKQTRNSGSTLPLSTRTPTKASRVVARTDAFPHCPPRLQYMHPPTQRWEIHFMVTTRTAVTAVAAAPRCLRITATTGQSHPTTSVLRCRPATQTKARATMTWSSRSARCTESRIAHHMHGHIPSNTNNDREFMEGAWVGGDDGCGIQARAAPIRSHVIISLSTAFRSMVYSIVRHFFPFPPSLSSPNNSCTATISLRAPCIYHKAPNACTNIHNNE